MNPESDKSVEIDSDILARYAHTFIPRFDRYPMQRPSGRYRQVEAFLSPEIVEDHIRGEITIGAYALDVQSQAKWIGFDADTDDAWNGLHSLAQDLAGQGVPSYRELSRRGGHLWLFLPAPLPGVDARRLGRQLLAEHGLPGVELYPKQDRLVTGPGSMVRLPLGRHQKDGRRYTFVTLTGEPLAPTVRAQLARLADPERILPAFVETVLARAPVAELAQPTATFDPSPPPGKMTGQTVSERIKQRISVSEFVRAYVPVDERGHGRCPFHDDQVVSFAVSDQGNFWHCFAGCGGGSVIDFWRKWRAKHGQDASFKATVADLADKLL